MKNSPNSNNVNFRDIFLSHKTINKPFVRKLAGNIESHQHKNRNLLTWIDEAEIRPGQSIPRMVNNGLETSRFIGLVMTPAYFEEGSGWTHAEWHASIHEDPDNRRASIIPILVEDCPYIPALLRHLLLIDFRGAKYSEGLSLLLKILCDEPLKSPTIHRGQLIKANNEISRTTLLAERSVPDAAPESISEKLYCNLLPVEHLPKYLYTAPISKTLRKEKKGKEVLPKKSEIKEVLKKGKEKEESFFMPAFRICTDRIITFHDLLSPDNPLSSVIEQNEEEIEELFLVDCLKDDDYRKIVTSLLNMALARHLNRQGLVPDDKKQNRFFFPPKNGKENTIQWKPVKKKTKRAVAKPYSIDGELSFWKHQAAFVKVVFISSKFYVQISPTLVFTEDGYKVKGGSKVSRLAIKWTGPQRNMQVLYDVRFWTSILRRGPGPISIKTGDQRLDVAPIPAFVKQTFGIKHDQKELMALLDEEAPIIAQNEEYWIESQDVSGLLENLDEDFEAEKQKC